MRNTAQNQSSSTYARLNVMLTLIVSAVLVIVATLPASAQTRSSISGARGSVAAAQQNAHGGSVPVVQQNTRGGEVPAVQNPNASIGNFGMIDFPGANASSAIGLNNKGWVVGGYGGVDVFENPDHSFVLKGTSFKAINYPGAVSTEANAINDSGIIVGYYTDSAGDVHGFQLSASTYTSIDDPKAATPYGTAAWGINRIGEIVGGYWDGTKSHGFTLSNGTYDDIDVPGSTYTAAIGINTAGSIVGWYGGTDGNVHGFLYDGSFTTIDYPGYPANYVEGINDKGQLVGGYGDGVLAHYVYQHGFLYQNGQFTSINVPFGPAAVTQPGVINNKGAIVGLYVDGSGTIYGFSTSVGP
jgi:probable HAF family extracellular repeat protein